jgi:hypothetical protein
MPELHLDVPRDPTDVDKIWFELKEDMYGWAELWMGLDNGSRPCTQKTIIVLSEAFDPISGLVEFARRATYGPLPIEIQIDSEGPESCFSLRRARSDDFALFEIRDVWSPAIHFAAIVDPQQLGRSLAFELRERLVDPKFSIAWTHDADWGKTYVRKTWLDTIDEAPKPAFDYPHRLDEIMDDGE